MFGVNLPVLLSDNKGRVCHGLPDRGQSVEDHYGNRRWLRFMVRAVGSYHRKLAMCCYGSGPSDVILWLYGILLWPIPAQFDTLTEPAQATRLLYQGILESPAES